MHTLPTLFKRIIGLYLLLLATVGLHAQVTCDPAFPITDGNVTIYFHANEGNAALNNFAGPIYAHLGVITNLSQNSSDWKHVQTTWGIADPKGLMTYVSPNLWSKTINIRTFFSIPANETVLKLAFVFRNQSGSVVGRAADGSDIFYDVYPNDGQLRTRFLQPVSAAFLAQTGNNIPVKAIASASGALTLTDNGVTATTGSGLTLETSLTAGAGYHLIEFIAEVNGVKDTSTFSYVVPAVLAQENPPVGSENGITYTSDHSVRLVLYAPGKQSVFVMGDFNNWIPSLDYQMRNSTDGNRWWLDIDGLTPGQVYRFQYLVDGVLKIADPLSTLVLDPWNDSYISPLTFPNMPAYPAGKTTGIVSVIQPGAPAFNWQTTNYTRPEKSKLTVYELLVRDFLARHDYPTLLDTLDYLQNLGVNAIELMPVSEFNGNINWGYGPTFHKALDKYYGSPEFFKTFIDECHSRGMAVILDVVFNQIETSPLAQLYWDAANSRPAANNPWLNPVAPHPFSVFNDFNHNSEATRDYMKNCVKYWIQEYRIDGFRFDLSKGFTQTNSGSNVGLWGQYDASRVALWKQYADFIWGIDPENYVILEHFADNSEEKELANYGMMLWGNMWGAYKDVALGYTTGINTSLTWIDYKQRQWNQPHVVGYMESHDEDRIGYECKTYGVTGSNGYNVKSLPTAMRRIEMLNNLFYTVPGPKMLWQFGELGYDFPINWCEDGTINNDCRTGPKPIRWDYFTDPYRRRLYHVTAALLHLRNSYSVLHTNNYQLNIGGGQSRTIYLDGDEFDVVVAANVGIVNGTVSVIFPSTGTWYEYYTGTTLNVTSTGPTSLLIPAGNYRLYTSTYVPLPDGVVISSTEDVPSNGLAALAVTPNPTSDRAVIWFELETSATVSVKVLDQTGREMADISTGQKMDSGEHRLVADMSSWPQGLYFIQVQTEHGGLSVKKVVKN